MYTIDQFTKWLITSFLLGIIGLIAVFFVGNLTAEMDRSILLGSTITIFILIFASLLSLVKANSNKMMSEIVISAFVSIIPLGAFLMNGLIFTVYFIGK